MAKDGMADEGRGNQRTTEGGKERTLLQLVLYKAEAVFS